MKGHSLDSIDQEEEDAHAEAEEQIEKEREGLFDVHPELLLLMKDYLKQTLKVREIENRIAKLKEIEK